MKKSLKNLKDDEYYFVEKDFEPYGDKNQSDRAEGTITPIATEHLRLRTFNPILNIKKSTK